MLAAAVRAPGLLLVPVSAASLTQCFDLVTEGLAAICVPGAGLIWVFPAFTVLIHCWGATVMRLKREQTLQRAG